MSGSTDARLLCGAALDGVIGALREAVDVERCTLRLDVAGDFFPVVHEARVPPAGTLIGDQRVPLHGQPVATALLSGIEQVVQEDSAGAYDDPAFQAMLQHYGGLGAQIVTPVRRGDRLVGIISLHTLGQTRRWTDRDRELPRIAAGLVLRLTEEPCR